MAGDNAEREALHAEAIAMAEAVDAFRERLYAAADLDDETIPLWMVAAGAMWDAVNALEVE